MSCLFAFSCCSWGFSRQEYWSGLSFSSPVDHILSRFGQPHTPWLSFIELDKTIVHVMRLASFLWLWFQSVCSLMPSLSGYRLIWVSLTLDVGYLLSRCSWPWVWSIFSRMPLLSLDVGYLLSAVPPDLGHGYLLSAAPAPCSCHFCFTSFLFISLR